MPRRHSAKVEIRCPDCGADMAAAGMDHRPWPKDSKVFHCTGGTGFGDNSRGQAHHSPIRPMTCWHCQEVVGCLNCLPSPLSDALCVRCVVWVTKTGFLRHGPILNDDDSKRKRGGRVAPGRDQYPPKWQIEYLRTELDKDVSYQDLAGMTLEQMSRYVAAVKA